MQMAEYLINKYLKKRTKRPVSDYYSDELLEAVDDYVEYNISQIEQARKDCDDPFIGVELKVSLAHRIRDCFGTADMVVVDSHKIHIIDLQARQGRGGRCGTECPAYDLWTGSSGHAWFLI